MSQGAGARVSRERRDGDSALDRTLMFRLRILADAACGKSVGRGRRPPRAYNSASVAARPLSPRPVRERSVRPAMWRR
jgi:hypothetical protein